MYIKPCFFISTCWSLDSQGQKWLNPQEVLYIFSGIKCNWLMGIHKYNHFQYVALYLLIIAFIWKHSISLYLSYFKFNMFTFYFFLRFFFVWCGPFLKSLLNLLQYCFCFMFLVFGHKACGILAPRPGIEPTPPALDGEVLTTGLPGESLFTF